jgi:hypothetical protein
MTTTPIHVNVYLDNKTIAKYFTLTPKPSTIKRRSSRRQFVQSKRKRLGLPVDGKIAPFMWSGEMCKPNRKESMDAALQADKMMRVYAQLGDAEDHRQYLIQSWLGWIV